MSRPAQGLDDAVRDMLRLMPQLGALIKRADVPQEFAELRLGPRHLTLLSYLLLDGPMTVNELARQLHVAPTTVSLMITELLPTGVLDRSEDPQDRRRRIVGLAADKEPTIRRWLGRAPDDWRTVLAKLSPAERKSVTDTVAAYIAVHTGN